MGKISQINLIVSVTLVMDESQKETYQALMFLNLGGWINEIAPRIYEDRSSFRKVRDAELSYKVTPDEFIEIRGKHEIIFIF
jgi:hypothetical protein